MSRQFSRAKPRESSAIVRKKGGGRRTAAPRSITSSQRETPMMVPKCRNYIKWPPPQQLRPRTVNNTSWRVRQLCEAYNFPTALAGGGTIGILELGGGWLQSDLDRFSQLNGLPAIQVTDISVD